MRVRPTSGVGYLERFKTAVGIQPNLAQTFSGSKPLITLDNGGEALRFEKGEEPVIIDARRLPQGRHNGFFKSTSDEDMVTAVVGGLLEKAGIQPKQVKGLAWGTVIPSSGQFAYLASNVRDRLGMNLGVNPVRVDQRCGSGLYAVWEMAQKLALQAGDKDAVYIAAGSENMTAAPYTSNALMSDLLTKGERMKAVAKNPLALPGFLWRAKWTALGNLHRMTLGHIPGVGKLIGGRMGLKQLGEQWIADQATVHFNKDLAATVAGKPSKSKLGFVDGLRSGLTHQRIGSSMGDTGESLAELLTTQELDEESVKSHRRANFAWETGAFADEVIPFTDANGLVLTKDEGIRPDTNLKKLADMRARQGNRSIVHAKRQDSYMLTPANCSSVGDSAGAVILTNQETASRLGIKPLGLIKSMASAGADPTKMGVGAPIAAELALDAAGLRVDQVGGFEVNEAFAPVSIMARKLFAVRAAEERTATWLEEEKKRVHFDQKTGEDKERLARKLAEQAEKAFKAHYRDAEKDILLKLNRQGGGIALGHPLGASGIRLTATSLKQAERNGDRYTLATLCEGGGGGIAAVFENPDGK